MKQEAGLLLILVAFTGLWLYNTGRLQAVLNVINNPQPQSGPAGLPAKPVVGGGGGGGTTAEEIGMCYNQVVSTYDISCVDSIWKGLNSPDDWLRTIENMLGGWFKF
jgi:hypothetical protein